MMSHCGVICATDCRAYKSECEGYNELEGKVSWAVFYERDDCPIYACSIAKGISSCAHCGEAPCKLWYDTRNPDASDEEFPADLNNRLNNLNKVNKEQ